MDVPFARQQPLDSYQSVQNGADAKSVANAEDPIFIPHHHHKEEHPTIANVSSVVLGGQCCCGELILRFIRAIHIYFSMIFLLQPWMEL